MTRITECSRNFKNWPNGSKNRRKNVSKYAELRKIDVSAHTEKKNSLTYLSWAWAVDQLLQQDPSATWDYREPVRFNDTLMVFCSVHAFGKCMTAQLPVMDHRNKAISNPDAFQVNVAMQRCLAKAIALHGIGLYIYAGEDLPEQDKDAAQEQGKQEQAKPQKSVARETFDRLPAEDQDSLRNIAMEVIALLHKKDVAGAVAYIDQQELDADHKVGLWSLLDSTQRSAIKKHQDSLKQPLKEAA